MRSAEILRQLEEQRAHERHLRNEVERLKSASAAADGELQAHNARSEQLEREGREADEE